MRRGTDYAASHTTSIASVGDHVRFSSQMRIRESGATSNGTRLTINTLDGSALFKWRIENVNEGLVKISSLAALCHCRGQRVLDPGYQHQLWTYNASHVDQKLRIVPVTDGYFKFFYAFNGLCWDITYNLAVDGTRRWPRSHPFPNRDSFGHSPGRAGV